MLQAMNETKTTRRSAEDCVEFPLLLSAWQCAALERAATRQGLTIGQLLRQLIAALLAEWETGWLPTAPNRPEPDRSSGRRPESP